MVAVSWFYENIGTKQEPRLADPELIVNGEGEPVWFHQSVPRFCTADWHNSGNPDLLDGLSRWLRIHYAESGPG